MCKPHYGNQDFFPWANDVYFVAIIKKIPLRNGNSPITKMVVFSTCLRAQTCLSSSMPTWRLAEIPITYCLGIHQLLG